MSLPAYCMTPAQAREWAQRMRTSVGDLVALYLDGWTRRADLALGYSSWEAMCRAEFREHGDALLVLPRGKRKEAVGQMSKAGMSTRAIGAALGVSKSQVAADLGEVSSSGHVPPEENTPPAPDNVVGLDGKRYPRSNLGPDLPPAREPGTRALAEVLRTGLAFVRAIERLGAKPSDPAVSELLTQVSRAIRNLNRSST